MKDPSAIFDFFHAYRWRDLTNIKKVFFFVVTPYILTYVQFTDQQMHFFILKNTLKFPLTFWRRNYFFNFSTLCI